MRAFQLALAAVVVRRNGDTHELKADTEEKWLTTQHCIVGEKCYQSRGFKHDKLREVCAVELADGACADTYGCRAEADADGAFGFGISAWQEGIPAHWYGKFSDTKFGSDEAIECLPLEKESESEAVEPEVEAEGVDRAQPGSCGAAAVDCTEGGSFPGNDCIYGDHCRCMGESFCSATGTSGECAAGEKCLSQWSYGFGFNRAAPESCGVPPADCTAGGALGDNECVFGDHCLCRTGVCEGEGDFGGECAQAGTACVSEFPAKFGANAPEPEVAPEPAPEECSGPDATFCSYPQYNIPGVGTGGGQFMRCDTPDATGGCPKRVTEQTFGMGKGETQEVFCATDETLREVWECQGCSKFAVVGAAVECPAPRRAKARECIDDSFCNYPQYNIPGVGVDSGSQFGVRCDTPDAAGGCPKRVTEQLYGLNKGGTQEVYCAHDEALREVWECQGCDDWAVVGAAVECPAVAPRRAEARAPLGENIDECASPNFCNYPQFNIPGVGVDKGGQFGVRCDTPDASGGCPKRAEWLYGLTKGDSHEAWCASDETLREVWQCSGCDLWTRIGPAAECPDPRA